MIKIIYRPNRFNSSEDIIKEFEFNRDKTLKEYLNESGFDYNEKDFIVSGDNKDNFNLRLDNHDEIIIIPKIKIPAIIGAFFGTFWAGVATVIAVAFVAYSIYQAITQRQRMPNMGSGADENSPTYGWDGIQNTQDVGLPISIIYGEHRVGGNIINQFIRADGNKQYLNTLLALSEGEIESISSVKINDNPSTNYDGITLTSDRLGTNDQTGIANFNNLHHLNNQAVNLVKNDDYVYTTVRSDVEAFELKLNLVGGLYQANSSGGINSWSVTYKVEYRVSGVGDYTDLGNTTISDKTRSTLYRTFRKDGLTAEQYDIRITRTSDDSQLDPMKQGDLSLVQVDEITLENLAYPNTALLGIEALATDQLSGSNPTITSLVKGRKVSIPAVRYDGDPIDWIDYYYDTADSKWKRFSDDAECTWDGETYENKWSANPVWCLRDLLTNTRYGLGQFIESSHITLSEWVDMAKYCETRVSDGAGGYEKRFRLDVVIDSTQKALDWITQLCATFRAFTFYSNGCVKIKIDKEETPVQLFGMGNIVERSFNQSWKSLKEKFNTIDVQFSDADKDYAQETVTIIDEEAYANGEPIRKQSIKLYCSRISQVIREGRYALNIAKHINKGITFRAGIDAIACQTGDLINISHDVPQWGFSGRFANGSTTTLIKLDRAVNIESGITYKIRVRFADDTQEERTVTDSVGNYTEVNVSSAFSQTPAEYDVYAFGEQNIVVAPYRVIGLKRGVDDTVEIEAIEYNVNLFDTDTINLPDTNYSALSFETSEVENLILTERLVKLGDGTIENVIDIWFQKPDESFNKVLAWSKAKIYFSDNDGLSWTYKGETSGKHFAIQGDLIDGETYKIAVTSTAIGGQETPIADAPQEEITLIGKTANPSNVTNFVAKQSRDRMFFGWTHISDADLDAYEIRCGVSWLAGFVIASRVKQNSVIILNFQEGASQSYWIKSIDTSGNYSATATEAVITVENIPFTNIIESYSEQTGWAGTKSDCSKVGDVLELDAGKLTGTYITPVRDVGYIATFKIGIEAVATVSGEETWADFGEETFGVQPETLRYAGSELAGATSYEIKTSDDNATWSDWSTWYPVDYKCRYFQLRMTLTRLSTGQDLECSILDYYADLPDVDEFGTGEVTDAGAGATITYGKTFHEIPSVNIDIRSGDAYLYKFSAVPDTTDFTVKLYDLSGVAKTGQFAYSIHGV